HLVELRMNRVDRTGKAVLQQKRERQRTELSRISRYAGDRDGRGLQQRLDRSARRAGIAHHGSSGSPASTPSPGAADRGASSARPATGPPPSDHRIIEGAQQKK